MLQQFLLLQNDIGITVYLFLFSFQKHQEAHQKDFYSLTMFVRLICQDTSPTCKFLAADSYLTAVFLCQDAWTSPLQTLNSSMKEKWHPLTLAERLWRPYSECELSEVVLVCFSSSDNGSGSPLLVQISMSATYRSLLMAGKNSQQMVVTVLKNIFFFFLQLRICSIKQYCCALCICCCFYGNKQETLVFRAICVFILQLQHFPDCSYLLFQSHREWYRKGSST